MIRKEWLRKLLFISLVLGFPLYGSARDGVPARPARVDVSVAPKAVAAGDRARVTVKLVPMAGIKINRYPKIKLSVPKVEGIVLPAEVSVGNPSPPPPDELEANYFKVVDPIEVDLHLDPEAPEGRHEIRGQLKYFYCVISSGYCAPARVQVKIPVTVR